jgi:hypothetical protein
MVAGAQDLPCVPVVLVLLPNHAPNLKTPVGAAEGCDLLILFLKSNIKISQPSAAPTGDCVSNWHA